MRVKLLQNMVVGVACGILGCGGSEGKASPSSGGSTGVNATGGSGPVQIGDPAAALLRQEVAARTPLVAQSPLAMAGLAMQATPPHRSVGSRPPEGTAWATRAVTRQAEQQPVAHRQLAEQRWVEPQLVAMRWAVPQPAESRQPAERQLQVGRQPAEQQLQVSQQLVEPRRAVLPRPAQPQSILAQ